MKRYAFLLLLLPFFLAPHKAAAQTSQEKCQQGACYGFGAPSGACVGGFIYSDISVTPVQAYSCKANVWSAAGGGSVTASSISSALGSPAGLLLLGDSISAGTGSSNTSLGFTSLERNPIGGHFIEGYPVPGDMLLDLSKWQHQAGSPFIGGPNTQIEIGTNDVTVYNSSSNLQTVFKRVYHESLLWAGIPATSKVFAQACTKTTGFSTADNIILYGLGASSITNGDVLTCTVTTGPNGDIAIGYMIFNGGGGTFTVKVNGTLQADPITASTTWIASGDGGSTITTSHNTTQGFAGAVLTGFPANTSATVAFTVTSATNASNIVEPAWVGTFPASSTSNPYVTAVSPNHQNNANDALSGTYAGYISALVNTDIGYGINAIYANTRDALGTNFATLYSDTLHPNDAGHALMASTIVASLPTALVTNSPPNAFLGLFNNYTIAGSAPINPMNFPNVNPYKLGNGSTVWSPGITLWASAGGVCWMAADPVHGAYMACSGGGNTNLCYYSQSGGATYPTNPSLLKCPVTVLSNGALDLTGAAFVKVTELSTTLGAVQPSAATINMPSNFFHVTGTAAINTINSSIISGCVVIIPDGAFTTTTAGNIAVASTAVVNKPLTECWDGTKWYPSY